MSNQKINKSNTLESLMATYTDSEGEDDFKNNSNENSDTPQKSTDQVTHFSSEVNTSRSEKSSSNSPADSSIFNNKTNNSLNNAPNSSTDGTARVQRLVSYFDDTVVSDDDETAVSNNEVVAAINGSVVVQEIKEVSSNHQDLLLDNEADAYGVTIPPEPMGTCPPDLQKKISNLFKKMESGRLDMNKVIQQRKDFRNPSIYEKLIQYCNINELGTNYPIDRFDPFKWGSDSYYEELAKKQKIEMEKLEKARKEKTKIEIVSGTAKRPNTTQASEDEAKKRRSKWDQITSLPSTTVKTGVVLSQQTSSTLSVSIASKTASISAFGSLQKRRL